MVNFFKRFWWLGIIIIFLAAFIFWMIAPADRDDNGKIKKEDGISFLSQPEERISVALPYSTEDEAIGMTPMGETVYHPVGGHPGIDFGWVKKAAVRASADGIITNLPDSGKGNGEIGLVFQSGQYYFEYGSLGEYAPDIRIGSEVKKGDILGYPLVKEDGQNYAIHWEMKPAYQYAERLCPLTYFDPESRARIEKLWAKTQWEYKTQFPEICNGKWKNLNSFQDILNWNNSSEKIQADKDLDKYKKENSQK